MGSRIMAVADIFTAIMEKRPYRDSMTKENAINILESMSDSYEIDKSIVDIVKTNFDELDTIRKKAHQDTQREYKDFTNEIEKIRTII
ncbi:MAG: hypothetical protein MUO60_16700 [Clostridiaceae bacterium]|nr:hypothetical protein [Clostridiaceae bacterium]